MKLPLCEIALRCSDLTGTIQRLENAARFGRRLERLVDLLRRLEAVRDLRRCADAERRRRTVADQLDDFEEFSDEDIASVGGRVVYSGVFRVVGIDAEQALRQYGRLRQVLLEQGIPNESSEFAARDLAYDLLGVKKGVAA